MVCDPAIDVAEDAMDPRKLEEFYQDCGVGYLAKDLEIGVDADEKLMVMSQEHHFLWIRNDGELMGGFLNGH